MEAPNENAFIDFHMAAHGIGACNVFEVSSEFDFKGFLGEGTKNEGDLALTLSGEIDTGYRSIMICPIFFEDIGSTVTDQIYKLIDKRNGKRIVQPEDRILASFVDAGHAIRAIQVLSKYLNSFGHQLEYNMALVTGKTVDENGKELFEDAKKHLVTLSDIGNKSGTYRQHHLGSGQKSP